MATISSTIWRVNPGRMADFREGAAAAKAIHERHGAEVTLLQWANAGSLTGTIVYGMTFPDLPAWGQATDAMAADPEWQEFLATTIGRPDPAGAIVSQVLANDVPGFDQPDNPAPGAFALAAQGRVQPGHSAADAVALLAETRTLALELGANFMRVLRAGAGGENSLRFTALVGFDSAAHYSDWQVAYLTDPRGMALNERAFGAAAPLTTDGLLHGRVLDV